MEDTSRDRDIGRSVRRHPVYAVVAAQWRISATAPRHGAARAARDQRHGGVVRAEDSILSVRPIKVEIAIVANQLPEHFPADPWFDCEIAPDANPMRNLNETKFRVKYRLHPTTDPAQTT
jgi:hypothetical protein